MMVIVVKLILQDLISQSSVIVVFRTLWVTSSSRRQTHGSMLGNRFVCGDTSPWRWPPLDKRKSKCISSVPFYTQGLITCCMVVCARVVECARADAKVCLLYRVRRHVASTQGRSMTNGANYKRCKLHQTRWHSDICTSNQLNANVRQQFDVSGWNSEVSTSFAASSERFVCHFGQYGSTRMSSMIFLCEHTIVIPQLPCLFRMANSFSSTVKLVNSVTFDSVNSFNFAMWALPASVSTLSWSHELMDGEELDDKQYIGFQGCQFPQVSCVNRIAMNAKV